MIRNPLLDRALAGSWALLDVDTLGPMMSARLGIAIDAVRPCYVRYKPGTSCIVQYELAVRDTAGHLHVVTAHLKLLADGRAADLALGGRAARLQARMGDVMPVMPRVVYLPEIDGLLQVFPLDLDLRALSRMASPTEAVGQLRKALGAASLSLVGVPELVRYKPGRKALLRYRLAGESMRTVYGKVLAEGRVETLAAQTRTLIAAGLSTPPVVGTLPQRGVVVHAEADGTQLASLRGEADSVDWMEPLAAQLRCLQSISVPGLRAHRLVDEAAALQQTAHLLGQVRPDLHGRLEQIVARLVRGLEAIPDERRTAHGDFYDDQALVGESGVALIDFDELRASHPLLDAGNMLAHLASDPRGEGVTGAAREAFCREVRQRYGASASEVALFEAVGLLKLAAGPFRRLEPEWDANVERIVALTERCADKSTGSGAVGVAVDLVSDSLLPQLDSLQDTAVMTRLLALALDDPSLAVSRIEVARHKAGRRAILRYHLADGTRLYGKTFASERGPKVYAVAQQVCMAKAFGAEVALPLPVAWLPGVRLVVQREVAGKPVVAALLAGDTDLAQRMAFALYQFHSSGLDLGRQHDLAKELSPLAMRVEAVMRADADLGARAEILQRLVQQGASGWTWRWRPIHRDLYHEQVLMDGDRLAVLDLDDASMSEPAVDVANMVAHLMLLGAQQVGDVEALSGVSGAFLAQYRQLDAELDDRLVQFLIGSTLLRLAGIHVGRQNGLRVARALLVAAERQLRAVGVRVAA